MKKVLPPGDMLAFVLENRQFSPQVLVRDTELPVECVEGILANEHPITPEVAELLGWFFGMSEDFWLNGQSMYDNQPGVQPMRASCVECGND